MTIVPAAVCILADSSWAKAMTEPDQAEWDEISALMAEYSRRREAQLVAHLDVIYGEGWWSA